MADKHDSENSEPSSAQNSTAGSDTEQESIASLKARAEKSHNDFLYLRADFENYKKHAIRERQDALKFGSERLIVDVLGVLDNFERALETKISSDNFANFVKGVEMTAQELRGVLQKFGVTEVPSKGKAFDPNMHEALGSEESKETPAGHIVRVFKKPYKLHEKLIRPGQVVIAKQPTQ